MRELVIVVSDLYLSPDAPPRPLPETVALPGLQHITRFGTRSTTAGGWRPWLARWLASGHPDLATLAPAAVAALAAPVPPAEGTVWIATPVHLVAGLSSVHLNPRGVLHLEPDDLTALAAEFRRVFHDSGFVLEPLETGEFLLFGSSRLHVSEEAEPARLLGASVIERGSGSEPALRRLSAEIEMWLHEHPVNHARGRRDQMPVTGLWLWGGGPVPHGDLELPTSPPDADIAFGCDTYLQGLWTSIGKEVLPLPQHLAEVFGYPQARRAVLVIEIGPMLHSDPTWTSLEALAQIDRHFLHPSIEALHSGKLERIVLLANDRQLALRARDRFKLWKRAPAGLSGLQ